MSERKYPEQVEEGWHFYDLGGTARLGSPVPLTDAEVERELRWMERAQEAEDARDRAQQALMAKLTEAGRLRERAEEAERRLANVREMVNRLRQAAGGGMSPGYALVRIEDMLNGQEPT